MEFTDCAHGYEDKCECVAPDIPKDGCYDAADEQCAGKGTLYQVFVYREHDDSVCANKVTDCKDKNFARENKGRQK